MRRPVNLGELSFYWRMVDRQTLSVPSPVPKFLPFSFGFDPALQLILQHPNGEVLRCLKRVYLENHNIGYMQPDHALADKYGQDFLKYIHRSLASLGRPVRSILEVGCGGCYILRELKETGYDVYGIDPSPVTARYGRQFGIPIVSAFYPIPHDLGHMDVILSCGILEHINDPVPFLRAHTKDLKPDGVLILSTPDHGRFISLSDVSMILHEHFNYFDEESLRNALAEAGFEVLDLDHAGYGASLYCLARPARGADRPNKNRAAREESWTKFHRFSNRVSASLQKMERYLAPLLKDRSASVGFYVPLRALPYLSLLKVFRGVRFFDDDPGIHGKYFDNFDIPVENFEDLRRDPVTHLLVMSLPHVPVIERKVRSTFGDRIQIASLELIIS